MHSACVVLLLVTSAVIAAVEHSTPPTEQKEGGRGCGKSVRDYLAHRQVISKSAKHLANKQSELAEAHRCPQHPQSSSYERAMDRLEYLSYCAKWAQRVNGEVLDIIASHSNLESDVISKAVAARDACVREASAGAKNPIELPARLLFLTSYEVVCSIYEEYNSNALSNFTTYLETTFRRGYSLYRRLAGRIMTSTKKEDAEYHAVGGNSVGNAAPARPSDKMTIAEVLLKILRLSIPDHVGTAAQLAGVILGPVLVIGAISAILVACFPILFGYFVIGHVFFNFWVRVLLVEGTLAGLFERHGNTPAVVVNHLLTEYPAEVFMYSCGAVGMVFLAVLVAFPWVMAIVSMVPSRPTAAVRKTVVDPRK